MNTRTLATALVAALLTGCGASWKEVGRFSVIGTRNFERNADHALLKRGAEAQVRTGTGETLQQALDRAVGAVYGGEYMANATIWLRDDAEYMRIVGDVWGFVAPGQSAPAPAPSQNSIVAKDGSVWYVGQRVRVPWQGMVHSGVVLSGTRKRALVEVANGTERSTTTMPWSQLLPE